MPARSNQRGRSDMDNVQTNEQQETRFKVGDQVLIVIPVMCDAELRGTIVGVWQVMAEFVPTDLIGTIPTPMIKVRTERGSLVMETEVASDPDAATYPHCVVKAREIGGQ